MFLGAWLLGALLGGYVIWWAESRAERERKILYAMARMSDYELKRALKGGISVSVPSGLTLKAHGGGYWVSQTITITYK